MIFNCLLIANSKIAQYPLPGEILSDLQDAFKFYDKDDTGYITITHFRNILHNFGFNKMSKKEIDDELRKNEFDPNKRTQVDFDTVKLAVAYRWIKGGKDEEAKECFKLFDKRDKGYVTSNDLKSVLPNYLEFPVTDAEIQELISECDPSGSGNIREKEFIKLYT